MLKFNSNILKWNGKWGNYAPPIYTVTCSATNGTVSAIPSSGITGTEVTLSNTPAPGYQFSSYTVAGATLKNANQFDIGNSNVTVVGNFVEADEVQIGNQIWSRKYLTAADVGITPVHTETVHGETIAFFTRAQLVNATLPTGWRLPTQSDFNTLKNYVGAANGKKLVSTVDGGTDDYGMNLYDLGIYWSITGSIPYDGSYFMAYDTYKFCGAYGRTSGDAYVNFPETDLSGYALGDYSTAWRLIKA